jgi:hypothetical protein
MYTRVMSAPAMALHGSEPHLAGPTAYNQGHGTAALVLGYMQALAQRARHFLSPSTYRPTYRDPRCLPNCH